MTAPTTLDAALAEIELQRQKLIDFRVRQREFMESHIGDTVTCEYCEVIMLSGEEGYKVFGRKGDEDDVFEVCDRCAEQRGAL